MAKIDPQKTEKKLKIAADLFKMAYETKKFQLHKKHPDLTEKEINHMAYALIEKGSK